MTEQKTINNKPSEKMSPSGDLIAITPADGVKFANYTKGIVLCDGDGSFSAVCSNGNTVTLPAGSLSKGVVYPFELEEIKATGTGATTVLGLF